MTSYESIGVGTPVSLTAKTRKGKNRLSELSQALTWGCSNPGPVDWYVVEVANRVVFSATSGPWLRIRPICSNRDISDKFERWVLLRGDVDFVIRSV